MSRSTSVILSLTVLALAALAGAQAPPGQQPPPKPATQTPAPSAAAPAATTPAAPAVIGPAKVAWINLELAIYSCEEGKREINEIQNFVNKKNAELQALQKQLETLKNQLQVQGAKLTDEAREDLEVQIETQDTNLQRFSQDTQKEIENRRVRTTNFIGRRMLPVIEKLSKEKGLSAVQYLNPSRDAWVEPSLIITEEVIKAYNQAHPVAATPAAPPPKKN
jgi:Skp family chaperone for outer membrane proteins